MKITPEHAAKIARLARLALPEEKCAVFAGQFEDILGHMDQLAEVDTSQVEPLFSPAEHGAVFREDEVAKRFTREDILSNAPDSDGRYFVVPKIV